MAENLTKGKHKSQSHKAKGVFAFLGVAIAIAGAGAGVGFLIGQSKQPVIESVFAGYEVTDAYLSDANKAYEASVGAKQSLTLNMTPDQMVNLAYDKLSKREYVKATGVGASKAMGLVDQRILSTAIKSGEKYFEESISFSSFVNIHDRMYQEGETTSTYWGNDEDYPTHPEKSMTNEEYATLMGRKVSESLVYIVLPSTITFDEDYSGDGVSKAYDDSGGYRIEIELAFIGDKTNRAMPGVSRYQKQMKTISNLNSYPAFNFCHLTFHTDAELNLTKFVTHESYDATMGPISAPCDGVLTTVYETSGPYEIPKLSDKIEYPESLD